MPVFINESKMIFLFNRRDEYFQCRFQVEASCSLEPENKRILFLSIWILSQKKTFKKLVFFNLIRVIIYKAQTLCTPINDNFLKHGRLVPNPKIFFEKYPIPSPLDLM